MHTPRSFLGTLQALLLASESSSGVRQTQTVPVVAACPHPSTPDKVVLLLSSADVVKVRMQLHSMQMAGDGRLMAPNLVSLAPPLPRVLPVKDALLIKLHPPCWSVDYLWWCPLWGYWVCRLLSCSSEKSKAEVGGKVLKN